MPNTHHRAGNARNWNLRCIVNSFVVCRLRRQISIQNNSTKTNTITSSRFRGFFPHFPNWKCTSFWPGFVGNCNATPLVVLVFIESCSILAFHEDCSSSANEFRRMSKSAIIYSKCSTLEWISLELCTSYSALHASEPFLRWFLCLSDSGGCFVVHFLKVPAYFRTNIPMLMLIYGYERAEATMCDGLTWYAVWPILLCKRIALKSSELSEWRRFLANKVLFVVKWRCNVSECICRVFYVAQAVNNSAISLISVPSATKNFRNSNSHLHLGNGCSVGPMWYPAICAQIRSSSTRAAESHSRCFVLQWIHSPMNSSAAVTAIMRLTFGRRPCVMFSLACALTPSCLNGRNSHAPERRVRVFKCSKQYIQLSLWSVFSENNFVHNVTCAKCL